MPVLLNILLEKLFYYGARGTPLKLLDSYLDNRFQCTKIGDTKSFFLCNMWRTPRIYYWAFIIPYVY